MRKIDIGELLAEKAVSYERHYPAPMDQQLRRAAQIGGVSTAVAIPVSLFFVPVLSSWAYRGFFWFLGDLSVGLLAILSSPAGIAINVIVLLGFALLWYQTQGLQQAPIVWHRVAFGLSTVGAADLAIIGMPVLIVALNVALWIVVIAVALAICAAGLVIFGLMASLAGE